jgi:hypothetical protein
LVVVDRDLANQVMLDTTSYLDSTAFLRTQSHFPIPTEDRRNVNAQLVALLARRADHDPDRVAGLVPVDRWLPHQSWGIHFMRRYFAPVIAADRSAALDRVVDEFVAGKTVGDDVYGRLFRMRSEVRERLHRAATQELERETVTPGQPRDLVDIVRGVRATLPADEAGELYLRMVQSVVGFTGAALEWAVLLADRDPDFRDVLVSGGDSRAYLVEAQRLFPTAWRLLRQAQVEHRLGSEVVAPGDDVFVATSVLHHSPDYWQAATEFRPERWSAAGAEERKAFLPFGRGRGACPGRDAAYRSLETALPVIFQRFTVQVRLRWPGKPYVRALLTAPRGRVRFRAS